MRIRTAGKNPNSLPGRRKPKQKIAGKISRAGKMQMQIKIRQIRKTV